MVVAEEGKSQGIADVAGGSEDEDTGHVWQVFNGVVEVILSYDACGMGRRLSDADGEKLIGEK